MIIIMIPRWWQLNDGGFIMIIIMMPRWWQLKYVFIFHPEIGEDFNFDQYFFNWVEATN